MSEAEPNDPEKAAPEPSAGGEEGRPEGAAVSASEAFDDPTAPLSPAAIAVVLGGFLAFGFLVFGWGYLVRSTTEGRISSQHREKMLERMIDRYWGVENIPPEVAARHCKAFGGDPASKRTYWKNFEKGLALRAHYAYDACKEEPDDIPPCGLLPERGPRGGYGAVKYELEKELGPGKTIDYVFWGDFRMLPKCEGFLTRVHYRIREEGKPPRLVEELVSFTRWKVLKREPAPPLG